MEDKIRVVVDEFEARELSVLISEALMDYEVSEYPKEGVKISRSGAILLNPDLMVAIITSASATIVAIIQCVATICREKKKYDDTMIKLKNSGGGKLEFPANATADEIEMYVEAFHKLECDQITVTANTNND